MFHSIAKFIVNNKYTLGLFFSLLFFSDEVFAAGTFSALKGAGEKIAGGLRRIIWPAATIGISCVCIGGMFGNFNWKWLIAIMLGVFIIAYSSQVGEVVSADLSGVD